MRRRTGFTLVELLIVLAFCVAIGAFAYRSMTVSHAHPPSARANYLLTTLVEANEEYKRRSGSYARSLESLGEASLINPVFAQSSESGYDFVYTVSADGWRCQGNPSIPRTTGRRFLFVDQTGVVRFSLEVPAGPTDRPFVRE